MFTKSRIYLTRHISLTNQQTLKRILPLKHVKYISFQQQHTQEASINVEKNDFWKKKITCIQIAAIIDYKMETVTENQKKYSWIIEALNNLTKLI